MILERTLHMLQVAQVGQDRLNELGRMGFMQWMGGLDGNMGFAVQAQTALNAAKGLRATDPAVEVFCALVEAAMEMPPRPLELALPKTQRRGGARRRRKMI